MVKITSLALFSIMVIVSCKDSSQNKSKSPDPGTGSGPEQAGRIAVEQNGGGSAPQDNGTQGNGINSKSEVTAQPLAPSLQVVGTLAVGVGLVETSSPNRVIAFEVTGSQFFSSVAAKALNFDVRSDGEFSIALPQKLDDHSTDKFYKPDGSIDVAKARSTYPPNDTQGKSDAEVEQIVRNHKAEFENLGYVLAALKTHTPMADDWQRRMMARKDDALTMQFIGLKSGSNSFLGLPVNIAKVKTLDLENLSSTGDDAKSQVPVSDSQFAISQIALDQIAQSNSAYKLIKNAYINVDPRDGSELSVGQTYSWIIDGIHGKLESDGFLQSTQMVDGYQGYTLEFSTNRPELTLEKFCTPNSIKLYPPTNNVVKFVELKRGPDYVGPGDPNEAAHPTKFCPSANSTDLDAKSRYFCDSNPISNSDAVMEFDGNGKLIRCPSPNVVNNLLFNADQSERTNNSQVEKWVRMTWGTDEGFAGTVPEGLWRLDVSGIGTEPTIGFFDIAKGYPFNANNQPILFMPRVKVIRDNSKKVAKIEVHFYIWSTEENKYIPASSETVQRIISGSPDIALQSQIDLYGYQEQLKLFPLTNEKGEAQYSLESTSLQYDWYGGRDMTALTNANDPTRNYEFANIVIEYRAYGSKYRFVMRDAGIY